jgi:hypothetical protein
LTAIAFKGRSSIKPVLRNPRTIFWPDSEWNFKKHPDPDPALYKHWINFVRQEMFVQTWSMKPINLKGRLGRPADGFIGQI